MTRKLTTTLAAVGLALLGASALSAQSKWGLGNDFTSYPSFIKVPLAAAPLHEDPSLPRVLIIGDSISMYYNEELRHLLTGKANVFRAPDNCQTTAYGLKHLDFWLGDGNWKVIQFNFGLHDITVPKSTGKHKVALPDYEKNLRAIVAKLQATGARLIWASSTPVPSGASNRSEADLLAYNAVARKVMDENRIPTDDLHAFIMRHSDKIAKWQNPKDVHFTPVGSAELAGEVAKHIIAELK